MIDSSICCQGPLHPIKGRNFGVWKSRWEKGKGGHQKGGWEDMEPFCTSSLSPKVVAFLYFSCSTVGGGQWGPLFEQVEGAPLAPTESCPAKGSAQPCMDSEQLFLFCLAASDGPGARLRELPAWSGVKACAPCRMSRALCTPQKGRIPFLVILVQKFSGHIPFA